MKYTIEQLERMYSDFRFELTDKGYNVYSIDEDDFYGERPTLYLKQLIKNGELQIKLNHVRCHVTANDCNLTTLKNFPKVCNDISIFDNKLSNLEHFPQDVDNVYAGTNPLTSLEGLPKKVQDLELNHTKIKNLIGAPEEIQRLYLMNVTELESFYGFPKSSISCTQYNMMKCKMSKKEYDYCVRMQSGRNVPKEEYFKTLYDLFLTDNDFTDFGKIKWPEEMRKKFPESLQNLIESEKGIDKFGLFEEFKTFNEYYQLNISAEKQEFIIDNTYIEDGELIPNKVPEKINGDLVIKSMVDIKNFNNFPKTVTEDFYCIGKSIKDCKNMPTVNGNINLGMSKLTSLEGIPSDFNADLDISMTKITSLKHCPQDLKTLNVLDCKLTSLEYFPKNVKNVIQRFDNDLKIHYDFVKEKEYVEYWPDLLKYCFEKNIDIEIINWPENFLNDEIIDSAKGGSKFNLYEFLTFDQFTLVENLKTNTDDVLKSIDMKEVEKDTFTINTDLSLEELADDEDFLNSLNDLSLKKEDVQNTDNSDTFLTKSISFMGIYPIQVLEIQNPEYLLIEIDNVIRLYKVEGDIENFYNTLTTKTIEIVIGESNWIYQTSNSGNNWILKNDNVNNTFKENMTTQELEQTLTDRMEINIL